MGHVILLTSVGVSADHPHPTSHCKLLDCALPLPLQSGASLTLGRSRLSSLNRRTGSVSYDHDADVGPPMVLVSPLVHSEDPMDQAQGQPASSFAFVEFESSSSEDEEELGEDGLISEAPPDYIEVVGDVPPRPLSMPPVGAEERLDISRNRASAYVLTSEPLPASVGVARAPPTQPQRQDPGFVYDANEGYQYYLNFIKVCGQHRLRVAIYSNRGTLGCDCSLCSSKVVCVCVILIWCCLSYV